MKKSFTINCSRSFDDIKSYVEQLIQHDFYQACELFYPNLKNSNEVAQYTTNIFYIKQHHPNIEFVFHLPFSQEYNVAIDSTDVLAKLKNAISYASQFGVKRATLHPGIAKSMQSRNCDYDVAVKNIKELIGFASKYGIAIMLENLVSDLEFMTSTEEVLNMLSTCNCGFTLDIGHAAVRKLDIPSLIYRVGKQLMHTHIHDNHFERDEHLPIGYGTIEFKPIFKALKEVQYSYLYGMEALFKDTNDLKSSSHSIDQLAKEVSI